MLKDAAIRRAAVWLVAGLAYLLWPLDLVPDWAVLVGWVDDAFVVFVAAYMAYQAYQDRMGGPRRAKPVDDGTQSEDDDPYHVLGVKSSAGAEEIKDAYRRRMAEYHPDKVAHLGPDLRALADKKAKAIQRAYEQLKP
ncbi:DUF1232 domain-containing protein [bacterium]|nr:MAG: DUF1232 domain-containing protein [bacterium]